MPSRSFEMRMTLSFIAAWLVSACASLTPSERMDAQAARAGAARLVMQGAEFKHVVYSRAAEPASVLTIFIESDGSPMLGERIVKDPTARQPIALPLMLGFDGPALLVGRPCYHALADARCSWRDWTLGRYSQAVVDSMAAVIRRQSRELDAREVQLVGYSGGGVLAVLIAERLDNVRAVITIAANLDVDAWTKQHGYTPLSESLDPARSERAHPWVEIHLQGGRDRNVPPESTRAYFERYSSARRVTFEKYDHTCCWVEDWAEVQSRVVTESGQAR